MQNPPTSDSNGIFGHPRGLTNLFFTEMWERFGYYGMRALLTLFMVAPLAKGGLEFSTKTAGLIYGTYTMSVYMLSIPGGFIADNFLGARAAHPTHVLARLRASMAKLSCFHCGRKARAIGLVWRRLRVPRAPTALLAVAPRPPLRRRLRPHPRQPRHQPT